MKVEVWNKLQALYTDDPKKFETIIILLCQRLEWPDHFSKEEVLRQLGELIT